MDTSRLIWKNSVRCTVAKKIERKVGCADKKKKIEHNYDVRKGQ